MSNRERNIPAFKQPLEDHSEHSEATTKGRLLQFKDNPEYVVRASAIPTLINEGRVHSLEFYSLKPTEVAETATRTFKELSDTYHIHVPTQFVVADDEYGHETVFSITDNIAAETRQFDQLSAEEKSRMQTAFTDVVDNLLAYCENKIKEGGYFWFDFGHLSNQFVYGKKKGDAENSVYMIDTDPTFSTQLQYLLFALNTFLHPKDGLSLLENKYGIDLTEQKDKALKLIYKIETGHSFKDTGK